MEKVSEEEFKQLISSEEGITIDFKNSDILGDTFKVAKTLTAFSNTIGGFLLIGVNDDKSIEGLTYSDNTIQQLVSISRDKCDPSLAPNIRIFERNGNCVYLVEVKRFDFVPHGVKGKDGNLYFIRIGESVRQVTPLELKKLFDSKGSSIEKIPLLKPYFVNSEDELVSELEIIPEFPIVEEKEVTIPYSLWIAKKSAESAVFSMLQSMEKTDPTSKKLVPVTLTIFNEGDSPAENIRVTIHFPEGFTIFEESDLESSPLRIIPLIHSRTWGGLSKHSSIKNICSGWIDDLGNDLKLEFNPILPHVPDEEKLYDVNITITQNNYPKSEHTLKLKVKPSRPKVIKKIEKPDKV